MSILLVEYRKYIDPLVVRSHKMLSTFLLSCLTIINRYVRYKDNRPRKFGVWKIFYNFGLFWRRVIIDQVYYLYRVLLDKFTNVRIIFWKSKKLMEFNLMIHFLKLLRGYIAIVRIFMKKMVTQS